MASAMVGGLLARGAAHPSDLICFSASGRSAGRLALATGIACAGTLAELVDRADALVIAFKPQHLAPADPSLGELTAGRFVISVLAGKTLASLGKTFPQARALVRCMPNTPGQIGAGITGWCASRALAPQDRTTLDLLLGALGSALEIPEGEMSALTAVSGSGPAYVFEFAGALRDAGIAAGLPAARAETLALATLLGASRLLSLRQIPPEQLRDAVTSPHGTTFAGLQRLAAGGFREVIRQAVLAAKARADELSRD